MTVERLFSHVTCLPPYFVIYRICYWYCNITFLLTEHARLQNDLEKVEQVSDQICFRVVS